MRLPIATAAIALLLAACSPPAPPPQQAAPAAEAPAPANPDAAMLSGELMPGQWFFNGDEGTMSAGFGAPESEYLFLISCNAPVGHVTLMYERELVPDQDTTLKIVTSAQSLSFAARSSNEGLPAVLADVAAGDPRLATLAAAGQARIAVDVAGETSLLPWDQSIARALAACLR